MKKNTLIIAFVTGLIGFGAGNAFWYLASPLWIDIEVNEALAEEEKTTLLASGTFVDADAIHKGTGVAEIYEGVDGKRIVSFSGFEVTNGPDLKVWLVGHENPLDAASVKNSEYVSLGALKGNVGNQNYQIPDNLDLSKFRSVVIWCKQFGVLFSTAALT